MSRIWRRAAIGVLVVVALLASVMMRLRKHEPSFNGKTVGEWVDEFYRYPGCDPSPWNLAYSSGCETSKTALLHFGTNSIPYLIQLARTPPDSRLKSNIVSFIRGHEKLLLRTDSLEDWFRGYASSAAENPDKALRVFQLLGQVAKPAVPELANILRQANNREAQASIVDTFISLGPAAEAALPVLAERLRASPGVLNSGACFAISRITDDMRAAYGKKICPAMLEVINDPTADVACAATFVFRCCGDVEQIRAAKILRKYLLHPNAKIRDVGLWAVEQMESKRAGVTP
jgi:hypothetical protein